MGNVYKSLMDQDFQQINVIAAANHTQLGPGNPELRGVTIADRNLVVGRLALQPLFLGHTVLRPGLALLYVPLSWKGELRLNGTPYDETSVGLVTGSEGYFTRGKEVDGTGIAVSKEALTSDLSTLIGVAPDELSLPNGRLTMPVSTVQRLRRMLAMHTSPANTDPPQDWALTLREGMLEALLTASLKPACRPRDDRNEIIVRRAEEYFMSIFPHQPSLVDLCEAAGVGKKVLYAAFHSLFGIAPVSYFRKRRLSAVQHDLLQAPTERGLIKRVALQHGFTELGRFAMEYRQLFGELPSHTLSGQK